MDLISRFFGKAGASAAGAAESPAAADHDIRVATCALFLEMAEVDGEFSGEEQERILAILKTEHGLDDESAAELKKAAHEELAGSLDIWQFTNRINDNYTVPEKLDVLRLMWRIVYADGKLDAHEDYLMRKISKLLRLSHRHMIDTKIEVLREREE